MAMRSFLFFFIKERFLVPGGSPNSYRQTRKCKKEGIHATIYLEVS